MTGKILAAQQVDFGAEIVQGPQRDLGVFVGRIRHDGGHRVSPQQLVLPIVQMGCQALDDQPTRRPVLTQLPQSSPAPTTNLDIRLLQIVQCLIGGTDFWKHLLKQHRCTALAVLQQVPFDDGNLCRFQLLQPLERRRVERLGGAVC